MTRSKARSLSRSNKIVAREVNYLNAADSKQAIYYNKMTGAHHWGQLRIQIQIQIQIQTQI